MKFVSGIRPYSQAERDRDHDAAREVRAVEANRSSVLRSGQDYNRPGTRAERRKQLRMVGEADEE